MRYRKDLVSTSSKDLPAVFRAYVLQSAIYVALLAIVARLFYWQIIKGPELQAVAEAQYTAVHSIEGERGKIFTVDGNLLVGNKNVYTLFAQPHILKEPTTDIIQKLIPILSQSPVSFSSVSAEPKDRELSVKQQLEKKLSDPSKKWVALQHRLTTQQKEAIQKLDIYGVGFDTEFARSYPEASMAAHITGFVGKDDQGRDTGYFGIEGKMNLELRGKEGKMIREQDAHGVPIALGQSEEIKVQPGRDVTLTIRRDLQFMLEQKLKQGIEKYGAISGEAVIMNPKTGDILAMISFPSYAPETFYNFPATQYKNPLVAEGYEPGSTFKVLTMAAGVDAGLVSPDTHCDSCATARRIAGYTIKTWNDQYTPNITMTEALAKSDNTAMIFVAEKLGQKRFTEYLDKFQIGQKSGIELQEDASTPVRQDWKPIDLATSSFGQGIAITGMQMVKAVSAIANDGKMMKPKIIHSVMVDGKPIIIPPEVAGEPISKQSSDTVTDMMVTATQQGEAKWAVLKDYTIAGKTGTAQIPVAGHYDEEKTIASFVGFAPAKDPQFLMLIKLREPKTSQWASETAAPLWYDIAKELFIRMNILPDRT